MALVTTASVDNGNLRTWDTPGGPIGNNNSPVGEVVFQGSEVIPAIGVGDTGLWTLQCNFPRNFVYRIVEYRNWMVGPSAADMNDTQDAWTAIISSDAPDFDDFYIMIASESFWLNATPGETTLISFVPNASVTNDLMKIYSVRGGPPEAPIDANSGAARIFQRAVNDNASSASVTHFWRIRALQYNVDQFERYPMHTPVPTIGP